MTAEKKSGGLGVYLQDPETGELTEFASFEELDAFFDSLENREP